MRKATKAWLFHILAAEKALTGYSLSQQEDHWEITLNFGPKTKMIRGGYRHEIRDALAAAIASMEKE